MTKPKTPRPVDARPNSSYGNSALARGQLLRLLEINATLYRRNLITADLLRWRMLDAGVAIDCPPEFRNPWTGEEPPELEEVVRDRELADKREQIEGKSHVNGKEPEMREDQIAVPAVSDMANGDFQRHINLRHPDVTVEDETHHDASHYRSMTLDHVHKLSKAEQAAVARADISRGSSRGRTIDPVSTATIGEDNE